MVESEQIRDPLPINLHAETQDGVKFIRLFIPDKNNPGKELAYLQMKDFGRFVLLSGIRTDEALQGQGIARGFVERAEKYLEGFDPPKFGIVNNQIRPRDVAQKMYKLPGWLPLEHPWMMFVPEKLRVSGPDMTVPIPPAEIRKMIKHCINQPTLKSN